MKKILLIIGFLMIGASSVTAQQAGGKTPDAKTSESEVYPELRIGPGWYGIKHQGNTIGAAEYDYIKSGPSGVLDFEWDPLPHRFVLESYFLNPKDYFGEIDYAYRDVVLLNAYSRSLFHNLNHHRLGPDDLSTPSPSFTDLNPGDLYGIQNQLSRGFIRLKTPDFPFHIFADARTVGREGTIQQRFLAGSGGLNIVSQSRDIDLNTTEFRAGANSHLGPIEAEYSHTEKKFEALGEKVLFDTSTGTPIAHNFIPDLKSSSDTVKIHTTYSGKIVLAGTYTNGDKKNEDSGAKAEFTSAAGDFMFMPVTSVIFTLKYRHYDLDVTNPDTVTATGLGTVNVRDSLSSTRDVVSGLLRYRLTDRLTLRGEYSGATTDRTRGTLGSVLVVSTVPPVTGNDYWNVPESTTKNTGRLGFNYRIMKKMTLRGDYSLTKVDNPAYDTDPDKANNARASLTWMPTQRFSTMLSYAMLRETRDELSAPLGGGSRDAARDQALASATVLIGSRSSITASYAYFKNKVEQTVTLQDGPGVLELEPDVPYDDTSHVGSLALTVAPSEGVSLTGSATRSYSRGSFRLAGAGGVTNVSGIAELSDLKVVDTVYSAGVEMEFNRYLSSELRYQHQDYDDEIDSAQDGKVRLILATVFLNW